MKNLSLILIFSFFLIACSSTEQTKNEKLTIVTTTNIIANSIQEIVGDKAKVESLMGANVDPHGYKASPSDIGKLQNADIIIHNGLHLEGKMADIFKKMSHQKAVFAVADGMDKIAYRKIDVDNAYDPHVWFDVQLWSTGIQYIGKEIAKFDTLNKDFYTKNITIFAKKLTDLDTHIKEDLLTIPENQRVLITTHDAFGYFGKAYNIQIKPLQGISTLSDIGLQDATNLSNFIIDNKIKSVFVETSTSHKSLQSIVDACKEKGHNVQIGGTLYADALGEKNTSEGTYIGMIRANIITIIEGLK